jgi:hypothetical protein
MHPIKHLKTVNEHRRLVRKYCFRLGLYRQGLMHDLSKYSPTEFISGAKYYSEGHSPVAAERRDRGVARGWLHHKGRNKHHPEYWIDYVVGEAGKSGYGPNKMPAKYVAEMFCDYLAASRIYLKEKYTDAAPYKRFAKEREFKFIHPETADELEKMLEVLKDEGEEAAFQYIRKTL